MTPKEKALKLLEARKLATPGEWDTKPAMEAWKANKANNAAFIRLAANEIEEIVKWALEMEEQSKELLEALEKISKGHPDGNPIFHIERAQQVLNKHRKSEGYG